MNESVDAKLRGLLGAVGAEISCEECFEALDRYVEAQATGESTEDAVPGMRTHLDNCPACAEDHASLLALIRGEEQLTDERMA